MNSNHRLAVLRGRFKNTLEAFDLPPHYDRELLWKIFISGADEAAHLAEDGGDPLQDALRLADSLEP